MKHLATHSLFALVGAAAAAVLLVACGGGGGSSSPTPPVATINPQLSVGTITGFGSVVINEVRYDDSSASISFDDSDDSVGTDNRGMQLGMNAELKGRVNDDKLSGSASEIHIESLVRGPASTVTAAATGNGGTIDAMGVKVVADDNTVFYNITKVADIKAGDIVNVHGLLNADGSVQAKFLEKRSTTKSYKTVGKTSATVAGASFKIGALTVSYDSTTKLRNLPSGVSDGVLVRVTGLSGSFDVATNTLKADKIKRVSPFEDHDMHEGEVKGPIVDLSADKLSFTVNGVKVAVSASTTYSDGTAANLVNGAMVEVHGTANNGVLQASKIEFGNSTTDDSPELHGTISLLTTTTNPVGFSFTVHGQQVQTDSATVFKLRSSSALANGMKVEVRGKSIVNGVLMVTKVSEENS
jgi:Domain of unknown function (DUF5666)